MRAASTRRKIAIQIAKAANREAAEDSQSDSEDGGLEAAAAASRCKNAWDVAAPPSATGKIKTL